MSPTPLPIRIATAASLLGIPEEDARQYLHHARTSLPGASEEMVIETAVDLLRRDHSQSAINQARKSVGLR